MMSERAHRLIVLREASSGVSIRMVWTSKGTASHGRCWAAPSCVLGAGSEGLQR